MPKILVLQGLPASGKSTYARDFIKDRSNSWIIVNRDSIRRMFGEYGIPKRENLVTNTESFIIEKALLSGWNVLVDDSNMNSRTIDKLKIVAKSCNSEIEFKKFEVPLDELIRRDANRENPVGEDVIRDFWNRYYENI